MNARDQFQAAAELFLRARGLPSSERSAFLDDACGSNAELRSQVAALLASEEHSQVFATLASQLRPVHGQLRDHLPSTQPSSGAPSESVSRLENDQQPNTWIGSYRLLEQVGEGGFGRVWVAEQSQPVQRRVAIKIIKAGMDSHEVLARFDAERQALALMEHPGIAKVFDAGVTNRGRPYFVMEYVPGLPITDHCNASRMRIRERLGVFVDVCLAVQHAHQRGIIHRDLKPSNVLVTLLDGRAAAKVIDFGIAKATSTRLTDRPVMTEMGRMMGTPEYMSPEQAASAGVDLDTRSDVYSLGVILYQLLTGTLPFDPKMLREAGSDGIAKIIREMEPPRPSTRISTLSAEPVNRHGGATPELLTRSLGTDVRSLQRELRGELDWIVMKCLEKDRSRRYGSASDLAADVKRYLVGQPVVAAPPGKLYRFQKLFGRNRFAFAAAAVVLATLVIGFWVSLALYFQEREAHTRAVEAESKEKSLREQADLARAAEAEQREVAEHDRDRAQIEAAKAERMGGFLRDMLMAIVPDRAVGREVTVRETLNDAAARLDRGELANEPEVEAEIHYTVGSAYTRLGDYERGERYLLASMKARSALLGEDHSDTLQTELELAQLHQARGDLADAERVCRHLLEGVIKQLGVDHPLASSPQLLLGDICFELGKFKEAESLYTNVLRIRRPLADADPVELAKALNAMGKLRATLGDYRAAELLWREALELAKNIPEPAQVTIARTYSNLGALCYNRAAYAAAMESYRLALEIGRKVLGPTHPELAGTLRGFADAMTVSGQGPESIALYREALAIQRVGLKEDHPQLAVTLEHFGAALRTIGKLDEAESVTQEALEIELKVLPSGSLATAQTIYFLGLIRMEQDRNADALGLLRESLDMRRKALGTDDYMVAEGLVSLGRASRACGELEEADSYLRQGKAVLTRLFGDNHPRHAFIAGQLALVQEKRGDLEGAAQTNRNALSMLRAANMGGQQTAAALMHNLGLLLVKLEDRGEAIELFREALDIRERIFPPDHPQTAATRRELQNLSADSDQ